MVLSHYEAVPPNTQAPAGRRVAPEGRGVVRVALPGSLGGLGRRPASRVNVALPRRWAEGLRAGIGSGRRTGASERSFIIAGCAPPPATSPRSVWTMRCACSTSLSPRRSNTLMPPPFAAWSGALPSAFRYSPATGARSRAGHARSASASPASFEQLSHKPQGWMDQEHGLAGHAAGAPEPSPSLPQDDDERFIVGLVLTYYRRHPQRARTRLLDLLGEVLTPTLPTAPAPAPKAAATPAAAVDEWRKLQQSIAPLKPKKR
ncbi:hypothetical protein Ddc_23152 [Ditylenchus destructor]|nr:hypothetical protein Ddc_23152 [Ditylenchus destructor]